MNLWLRPLAKLAEHHPPWRSESCALCCLYHRPLAPQEKSLLHQAWWIGGQVSIKLSIFLYHMNAVGFGITSNMTNRNTCFASNSEEGQATVCLSSWCFGWNDSWTARKRCCIHSLPSCPGIGFAQLLLEPMRGDQYLLLFWSTCSSYQTIKAGFGSKDPQSTRNLRTLRSSVHARPKALADALSIPTLIWWWKPPVLGPEVNNSPPQHETLAFWAPPNVVSNASMAKRRSWATETYRKIPRKWWNIRISPRVMSWQTPHTDQIAKTFGNGFYSTDWVPSNALWWFDMKRSSGQRKPENTLRKRKVPLPAITLIDMLNHHFRKSPWGPMEGNEN